jgi:hypothetical protein
MKKLDLLQRADKKNQAMIDGRFEDEIFMAYFFDSEKEINR